MSANVVSGDFSCPDYLSAMDRSDGIGLVRGLSKVAEPTLVVVSFSETQVQNLHFTRGSMTDDGTTSVVLNLSTSRGYAARSCSYGFPYLA